ncbi:hypothetical protein GIY56_12630 [Paracoccus sp. YIM 132242]|uniref:Uncharacterized protein n=1 Tax=Paracoccus lichenicola TaxID=2665644 RepID=A0A6L6HPP4_9RHOB|nr:hypothetical protein [Paracoccus lichenicola]MTE01134.1 hypothetical protein [Paracoccus lichenicola]
MGASLSAIFFDRPAGHRERIQAEQDGQPIPRPFIAAELALRSGGVRHVMLVPQSIETVLSRRLVLRLGKVPVAEIDPDWLQLPQEEFPALVAQLSGQGLRKLLRVMLTTGASLFAGRVQTGLGDVIPNLMDICGIAALKPVAGTQIAGRMLLTYSAPGVTGLRDRTEAIALLEGRLIHFKGIDCLVEGELLHVLLPPGLRPAQIVLAPDAPLRLAKADASLRQLSARAWTQARGKACRDWLFACGGSGAAASLEGECSTGLIKPGITIRHLSLAPAGMLYAMILDDPGRVVRKVLLEWRGQHLELTLSHGVDGTARLTGLAALPGEVAGGEPCRIRVLDRSGRLDILAEAPVAAYDGSIPDGFEDAWTLGVDALRPLARARSGVHRAAPPSITQYFGPTQRCGFRILTSIGSSADLIRARAAMILAEGHGTPVEIVCTMAEGPLALGARQALAQAAAIHGIPHRLVLLPGATTAGERLRAALVDAGDAPALVLGADVLPENTGWLAFWVRRLRRQGALAPVLLASDGSIAATREGEDPWQGLPAAHLPASTRVTDRPLANCLALGRAGIAQLLHADAPHPDPAVWIASALRGSARAETRFPFRRFGPAPTQGAFAAALADTEFAMIEKNCE